MSFRNRCQVMGSQGMVELSIPLLKGRGQKTLMKDVRIDHGQNWQAQHWKTIVACYNRSPWFGYFRDELAEMYRRQTDYLLDWDLACLEWTMGVLGWSGRIGLTTGYRGAYPDADGMIDWRGRLMPRDRGTWGRIGPEAQWGEDGAQYHQVFGDRTGFIPNLSILDLLFCEGKEAIRYIRS